MKISRHIDEFMLIFLRVPRIPQLRAGLPFGTLRSCEAAHEPRCLLRFGPGALRAPARRERSPRSAPSPWAEKPEQMDGVHGQMLAEMRGNRVPTRDFTMTSTLVRAAKLYFWGVRKTSWTL